MLRIRNGLHKNGRNELDCIVFIIGGTAGIDIRIVSLVL